MQHMQVKPERVLIDIDSDNTAKRVASTYFPNTEILADSIYVRKLLDRILRQAYDNTLSTCNKDYNFSLLKDRGKDVFVAEDGANRAVPDNVRQRMQTAYPVLWNQYITRCHGLRPYKVEPQRQEPTFDNWSRDVTHEADNAIFIPALLNIVPFKELLLAFARVYYNVPRVDYVQEVESLECNLKEKLQDGLRKNVSWELFRGRILYGTIVDVYARRYNRVARSIYGAMNKCYFCMDICMATTRATPMVRLSDLYHQKILKSALKAFYGRWQVHSKTMRLTSHREPQMMTRQKISMARRGTCCNPNWN